VLWGLVFRGFGGEGFRGAIGPALDLDNDGTFDETVQESHRQWRVAQIVGPGVEVDVGEQGGGATAMTSDNNLVEQVSGFGGFEAFDFIECELVD
jgi:hypothetical protein